MGWWKEAGGRKRRNIRGELAAPRTGASSCVLRFVGQKATEFVAVRRFCGM